jgi:adenylylsulfate reductase, subunit B
MSIKVDKQKCIACGKCINICPGNLLERDASERANIKYPKDCWGCAACLKECPAGAIKYFLGADIGGKAAYLYTKDESEKMTWYVVKGKEETSIVINKKESNRY